MKDVSRRMVGEGGAYSPLYQSAGQVLKKSRWNCLRPSTAVRLQDRRNAPLRTLHEGAARAGRHQPQHTEQKWYNATLHSGLEVRLKSGEEVASTIRCRLRLRTTMARHRSSGRQSGAGGSGEVAAGADSVPNHPRQTWYRRPGKASILNVHCRTVG